MMMASGGLKSQATRRIVSYRIAPLLFSSFFRLVAHTIASMALRRALSRLLQSAPRGAARHSLMTIIDFENSSLTHTQNSSLYLFHTHTLT